MVGRSSHRGSRIKPPETVGKHESTTFRPLANFGPVATHRFAGGSLHLAPFTKSLDAVLPLAGAYCGAAWLNIAPFTLVEARQSSEECAGTDRAARRPPPFGRSCSARGRRASRRSSRAFPAGWSVTTSRCRPAAPMCAESSQDCKPAREAEAERRSRRCGDCWVRDRCLSRRQER